MLSSRASRVLLAVSILALGAAACGTGLGKATRTSFLSSYALFALSGAPANSPTAISFLGGETVANSGFSFDVAVDIDPAGTTRIYPVRLLGSSLANATLGGTLKRVGLQAVTGSFDALTEAPTTGYDTLTAPIAQPGSVFAVQLTETANCLYDLGGTTIYAKLVIDSIRTADRRVFARSVVDPNCGYRGLVADSIPSR